MAVCGITSGCFVLWSKTLLLCSPILCPSHIGNKVVFPFKFSRPGVATHHRSDPQPTPLCPTFYHSPRAHTPEQTGPCKSSLSEVALHALFGSYRQLPGDCRDTKTLINRICRGFSGLLDSMARDSLRISMKTR